MDPNSPYDAASILDHPALAGLGEFLQQEYEVDSIEHFHANRFMGHEQDITLLTIDPIDVDSFRQRQYEEQCERFDSEQTQISREQRQRRLFEAGFDPDADQRTPWDNIVGDPSILNPFQGTCLEEPDIVSDAPSSLAAERCRQNSEEEVDYSELATAWIQGRIESLEEETSKREKEEGLMDSLDRVSRILVANQRQIPALNSRFLALATDFRAKDEPTYKKWEVHIANATKSSQAACRVWSIALWFQKVPRELWGAVRDLAVCHLTISGYTLRLKKLRMKLEYDGAEDEVPCCWDHTFDDDETWQSAVNNQFPGRQRTLYFGDDYTHDLPNGFSDYRAPLPEGKSGVALAQHIMANLETRKIRVEHEGNAAKRTAVISGCSKFIDKVQNIIDLEVDKLLGEDSPKNPPAKAIRKMEADLEAFKLVHTALFDARAQFGLPQKENVRDLLPEST